MASTIQLALLRREQGRPAEADLVARHLASEPGAYPAAVRACLLSDLGRDTDAWAALTGWIGAGGAAGAAPDAEWLATAVLFAEVAAEVADAPTVRTLYDALLPFVDHWAVDAAGAASHGSTSRHLGRLAHRLDRWGVAGDHFESALAAHTAAGPPLLLAHTRRQYAALLRVRGAEGDWDLACDLLARAEDAYRRLRVDRLARHAQAVLARADGPEPPDRPGGDLRAAGASARSNVFRRDGAGWTVRYRGVEADLADARGLADLATLLGRPGLSVHVIDVLTAAASGAVGTAASGTLSEPWRAAHPSRLPPLELVDHLARAEHHARLDDLTAEADVASRAGDVERGALAAAETDVVESLLARDDDSLELARDAVVSRLQRGVDRVERAHASLGSHLRRTIRTGTFCSYEPPSRTVWET